MSGSNLPVDAKLIEPFLRRHIPDIRILGLRQFSSGQSNPTYLIETDDRKLVLRCKPPGSLLPSAHLVEREFRVMRALDGTDLPVPGMLALAEDSDSPIGRAFFVMEHIEGDVFFDPALPGLNRAAREKIYDQMNSVLARLHSLDPAKIGLSSFGRAGDYFSRQIHVWTRQYLGSRAEPDRRMDELINWLNSNLPDFNGGASLVHGDFRLDNLIFCRSDRRALALLDWELSTLGHPLADLAYQCAQWRMPHSAGLRGLGGIDRKPLGLPEEEEYVRRYCQRRSIPYPENWSFCLAFGLFRLAAILEGVARRAAEGNASNPEKAASYGQSVPVLAEIALEIADSK